MRSGGVICGGLGVDVVVHRPGRRPTVVEHLGDVVNTPGLLVHPQRQVVVLAAVVADPESAHRFHQRPTDHQQVAKVHLAAQPLGAPVGLEERQLVVAAAWSLLSSSV
jgi:hypothetical protein